MVAALLSVSLLLPSAVPEGCGYATGCPTFPVSEPRPVAEEHTLRAAFAEDEGDPVQVVERIVLPVDHTGVDLMLPDSEHPMAFREQLQREEDRRATSLLALSPEARGKALKEMVDELRRRTPDYYPEDWNVRLEELRIDGRPAKAEHHATRVNEFVVEGGWRFRVPRGAREVVLRWSLGQDMFTGGAIPRAATSFRFESLSAWGAPPKSFSLELLGFGDAPATLLWPKVTGVPPTGACDARWRFQEGVLSIRAVRCIPRGIDVSATDNLQAWTKAGAANPGDAACDEIECPSASDFLRGSWFYRSGARQRWLELARGIDFDARSLALARNTPYASCGYDFKTPWLNEYFMKRPWYCARRTELPVFAPEAREEVEGLVSALKVMEDKARAREQRAAPAGP